MESEPGRHEYLPQARYGIDIRRAKQANELTISIADKERFFMQVLTSSEILPNQAKNVLYLDLKRLDMFRRTMYEIIGIKKMYE